MKGRLRTPSEFEDIIVKTGADGRVVRAARTSAASSSARSATPTNGYADRYPAVDRRRRPAARAPTPGGHAGHQGHHGASWPRASPRASSTASSTTRPSSSRSRSSELYKTILEAIGPGRARRAAVPADLARDASFRVVAIPVSLIGTFAVMQALGFSLNMLTLFGLVLAVGIVVDDAIVVVENVERKLTRGAVAACEAARVTMDEVGTALIAIALVLLAGVRADRVHRRHHRAVLPPVRGDDRHRDGHLAVRLADAVSPALCALLFKPHERRARARVVASLMRAGARVLPRLQPRLRRAGARLRPRSCAALVARMAAGAGRSTRR